MKTRIAIIIISCLAIGFGSGFWVNTYVQSNHSKRQHKGKDQRMKNHLVEKLNLTPEQIDAFDPIFKSHINKMKDLHTEKRSESFELMDSFHTEVIKLLDEDQKLVFNKIKNRHKKKGRK